MKEDWLNSEDGLFAEVAILSVAERMAGADVVVVAVVC